MENLKNILPNFEIEQKYSGRVVAGIDEAGRGPIAGPVVAAITYIALDQYEDPEILMVNDSKKISPKKRKVLFDILQSKIKFGVGVVDQKTIDEINILQATKLAMFRAYQDFSAKYDVKIDVALVDGNFNPFTAFKNSLKEVLAVVKGDQKSISIASASIIAKEWRDAIMMKLHGQFPEYSWDKNSGYPTKLHIEKINEYGITEHHRQSFAPVKKVIESS